MARIKRPIRIDGCIAYVPLTKGYEAVIDAFMVDDIGKWNWQSLVFRRADGSVWNVYAVRSAIIGGSLRKIYMHREIAKFPEGVHVDHINGDGLNNLSANLRAASATQNRCNSRRRITNQSGVKGVSWDPRLNKWRAVIMLRRKQYHLGLFEDKEAAAAAYAKGSAELHGEFGRTG